MRPEQLGELLDLVDGAAARRESAERREEAVEVVELARLKEVEDGPELRNVILQRRARQHELAPRPKVLELMEHARMAVLEPMALIRHHVRPLDLPERLGLRHDHLERREDRLELVAVLLAACELTRLGQLPIVLEDHLPY